MSARDCVHTHAHVRTGEGEEGRERTRAFEYVDLHRIRVQILSGYSSGAQQRRAIRPIFWGARLLQGVTYIIYTSESERERLRASARAREGEREGERENKSLRISETLHNIRVHFPSVYSSVTRRRWVSLYDPKFGALSCYRKLFKHIDEYIRKSEHERLRAHAHARARKRRRGRKYGRPRTFETLHRIRAQISSGYLRGA